MIGKPLEQEQEENIEADLADSPKVSNALNIKMLQPKRTGYERPYMPDLPPEGNVLGAAFRRENEIGQYLNSIKFDDFGEKQEDYNYLDHIPADLFESFGHQYALTVSPENAEELTSQLRYELNDREIMHNKPWRAFLSTFVANLVTPSFLLPGGTLYRTTKAARGVATSMLSVGAAAATAQSLQEISRHQTQQTASLDESFYNVLGAGIIGGMFGGLGGAYVNGAIFNKAKGEIVKGLADDVPIGPTMTAEQSLSAQKVRDPEYEKEMNSLYGSTPTAAIGKFLGYVTQKLTPFGRLIFSPFPSSRAIVNELLEHNLLLNAHLPGTRKVMGPDGIEIEVPREAKERMPSVETEIKQIKRNLYSALIDYQKIFYSQAGIKGPFKGLQQHLVKSTGLSLEAFEKAAWRGVISGNKNDNAAVQQATDLIMEKFFNPVRDEYIKLGIFTEDITVKTAANYFMRVYNRAKMRDPAQRALTQKKFASWIQKNDEELRALEPQVKKMQQEIAAIERKKKLSKSEKLKMTETIKKQLQDLVPNYLWNSKGEIRKIIDSDYYTVEADKIIDNILGFGQDEIFNPVLSSLPGKGVNPLKERAFLIPDELIEDELITSFLEVAPLFINATAPNIALHRYAKRIGFESEGELRGHQIRLLKEDYEAKVAKSPKNQEKYYKRYKKDTRDIAALFNVLKGIHGLGPNMMDSSGARFVKNLSSYNYLRYMGLITLQALTDAGTVGMKHGLFRTVYNGLLPMLEDKNIKNLDKDFLNDLGLCTNTLQGYRLKGFIDQDDSVGRTGLFSRAMDTMSSAFGNMTLMNQWTDAMQYIAGKTSMARTLRAVDQWAKSGTLSLKEKTRLNDLGISEKNYKIIHDQFKKYGGKTRGSYWVNWGKWDADNEALHALDQFKKSVLVEVDQTVVSSPSVGGKPLWAHTKEYGWLFQFKGFSYASTNKTLIAGLQRGDAEFYEGLVMTGALALLGYVATTTARGGELDLSYDNLFKEMIDRSGITGVFGNIYKTGNKLGIIPGKELTSYQNRGIAACLGGPTVGAIEDSLDLLRKALHDESIMNTNDMYKLFRFLPTQNYVFTNQLNRQVAKDFADYLGWEESPE